MKKKIILLSVFSFFFVVSSWAQIDTAWSNQLKNLEKQFEEYEKSVQSEYDKFVDKNDKQFGAFLEKAWKEIELNEGLIKKEEKPKPVERPMVKKTEITQVKAKPIVIEPVKEVVKIVPKRTSVPITPGVQKKPTEKFIKVSNTFDFYGTNVFVSFDEALKKPFKGQLLPKDIAAYWGVMSEAEHYKTVNDLLSVKKYLQLPDWGYLKLVEQFSAKIFPSDNNSATMLTWFLMNKSRYKVRLAYSRLSAYLLVPSQDVVYRTRYYTFDNIRYYLFDKDAPKVYTYEEDYPDAKMYMGLSIDKPLLLHNNEVNKKFTFEHEQQQYNYSVSFNKNLVDFYAEYPPTEIDVNFNAPLSELTYTSFINNVKPLIAGKSKIQAANLLLALVQKSFAYKTDQDQFGYEKYFFTEELFYYPASDCEDRSVLFAKLSNNLLERETIGLKYPGHMATAMILPELSRGDYIQSNGLKYFVADATFENAPVGMCMSQFRAVRPKVIQTKILRSLAKSNFIDDFKKANPNLAISDDAIKQTSKGNKIVAGTFSNTISFGGKTFTAKGINTFVANFSSTGDLTWLKVINSMSPNFPKQMSVKGGKIYISGIFSDKISIDAQSLTSPRPEHFVAVFDESTAKLQWIKSMNLVNSKRQGDFIYAARLSNTGDIAAVMYYDRKDYFDNFGFKIYPDGSLAVSNSFFGLPENTDYAAKSTLSFSDVYSSTIKKAKAKSSNVDFIAFTSVFNALRVYEEEISGTNLLNEIAKQDPRFSSNFAEFSKEFKNWTSIRKDADFFHVNRSGVDYQLDDLLFSGDLTFSVSEYSSANVFVDFRDGFCIYVNGIKYKANSMVFDAKTGKVLIDYSRHHYRKEIDLADF